MTFAIGTNYLINVLGDSEEVRDALTQLPVLKNPSKEFTDLLLDYGKIINLKKGEVLIKEGDFDQWVHILLRGSLIVYIGDRRIDEVSESLVGERCILGETRKATLKAACDDTTTFAIDMALLDAMAKEGDEEKKRTKSELIAVVCDIIIRRVIDLNLKQQTASIKRKGDERKYFGEKLLPAFSLDQVPDEAFIHTTVYRYLTEHFPGRIKEYWNSENSIPDYPKVFELFLNDLKMQHLPEIIDLIYEKFRKNRIDVLANQEEQILISFEKVTDRFRSILREKLPDKFEEVEKRWREKEGDLFSSKNVSLCDDLGKILETLGIPYEKIIDITMKIMEESLEFNSLYNGAIRQVDENRRNFHLIDDFFADIEREKRKQKKMEFLEKKLIAPYLDKLKEFSAPSPQEKESVDVEEEIDMDQILKDHASEGKVSNDDMEQILNDHASGGKISNNDMDALFEQAEKEEDTEKTSVSNDDMDALFNSVKK